MFCKEIAMAKEKLMDNKQRDSIAKSLVKTVERYVKGERAQGFPRKDVIEKLEDVQKAGLEQNEKNKLAYTYLETHKTDLTPKKKISKRLANDFYEMAQIYHNTDQVITKDVGGGKITPLDCIPQGLLHDYEAYIEQFSKRDKEGNVIKTKEPSKRQFRNYLIDKNYVIFDSLESVANAIESARMEYNELIDPENSKKLIQLQEEENKLAEQHIVKLTNVIETQIIAQSGNENVKEFRDAFKRKKDWRVVTELVEIFSKNNKRAAEGDVVSTERVSEVMKDMFENLYRASLNKGKKFQEVVKSIVVDQFHLNPVTREDGIISLEGEVVLDQSELSKAAIDLYKQNMIDLGAKDRENKAAQKEFEESIPSVTSNYVQKTEMLLAYEYLRPIDEKLRELREELNGYYSLNSDGSIAEQSLGLISQVNSFHDERTNTNINYTIKIANQTRGDLAMLSQETVQRYQELENQRQHMLSALSQGLVRSFEGKATDGLVLDLASIEKRLNEYENNPIYQNIVAQREAQNDLTDESTDELEEEITEEKIVPTPEPIVDEVYEGLGVKKDATMEALASLYERSYSQFAKLPLEQQSLNIELQEKQQSLQNQMAQYILQKEYPNGFAELTESQKKSATSTYNKVSEMITGEAFNTIWNEAQGETFEEKINILAQRDDITTEQLALLRHAKELYVVDENSKVSLNPEYTKTNENGEKVVDSEKILSKVAETQARLEAEGKATALCAGIIDKVNQGLVLQEQDQVLPGQDKVEEKPEEEIELLPNVAFVKFSPKYSSAAGQLAALKKLAAIYASIPSAYTTKAAEAESILTDELIVDEKYDVYNPHYTPDPKNIDPIIIPGRGDKEVLEEDKYPKKEEDDPEKEEEKVKTRKWRLIKQPIPFKKAVIVEKTFTSTGIDKETLQIILNSKDKQTKEFTDTIKFMIEQQTLKDTQDRAMRETENFQKMEMIEKVMTQYKEMFDKLSENFDKLSENQKEMFGEMKEMFVNYGKYGKPTVVIHNIAEGANVIIGPDGQIDNRSITDSRQFHTGVSIEDFQEITSIVQTMVQQGMEVPNNEVLLQVIKEIKESNNEVTKNVEKLTELVVEKVVSTEKTTEKTEKETIEKDGGTTINIISGDYVGGDKKVESSVTQAQQEIIDYNNQILQAISSKAADGTVSKELLETVIKCMKENKPITQEILVENNIDIDLKDLVGDIKNENKNENKNEQKQEQKTDVKVDGGKGSKGGNGGTGNKNPGKNKKPGKTLDDFGKDGLDVMDDLWFVVRHEHAENWVESIQKKIDDMEKINPNDKKLDKLRAELKEANKFEAVTRDAIENKDPKIRDMQRERLLGKLTKDFDASMEDWKVTDFSYDPTKKGVQNALLEQHMSAEANILMYIADLVEKNPQLAAIYDQRGVNGSLNGFDKIVEVLNKYNDAEYGKLGDWFATVCKGAGGLEFVSGDKTLHGQRTQAAYNAFGKAGEGVFKEETNTQNYHIKDDGRQA